MPTESRDPYAIATTRLQAEGFALNARTCFYERGFERLKLRWNGKVYARRRGPDAPDLSLPSEAIETTFGPSPAA